jgi:hypothetical protein
MGTYSFLALLRVMHEYDGGDGEEGGAGEGQFACA